MTCTTAYSSLINFLFIYFYYLDDKSIFLFHNYFTKNNLLSNYFKLNPSYKTTNLQIPPVLKTVCETNVGIKCNTNILAIEY